MGNGQRGNCSISCEKFRDVQRIIHFRIGQKMLGSAEKFSEPFPLSPLPLYTCATKEEAVHATRQESNVVLALSNQEFTSMEELAMTKTSILSKEK